MKTSDIRDDLFRQAVDAVDAGDIEELKELIDHDPGLVQKPLQTPGEEGYFKNPYLLWFIADNPIRNEKLSPNIVELTQFLARVVKQVAPETAQFQLDYALALVATGRTPRECNVQIELIDALVDAGAQPGGGIGALANGNTAAAMHLIDIGGKLTLPAAVGLRRMEEITALFPSASPKEKLTALTVAAFYGMADLVSLLLKKDVDPNGFPEQSGFHGHGTPLHQAVSSGSLETVQLLVEAGADLAAKDKMYDGTPLDWANYMQRDEDTTETMRQKYQEIEDYLKSIYNPE